MTCTEPGTAEYRGNVFSDPATPTASRGWPSRSSRGSSGTPRECAPFLAPLGDSYKRLVPGYEAPVTSWARINRSALIRVPRSASLEATRLELRCPDPSCNPYLAFAVMLKCGLDGIKNELPVPDAAEENLFESEWVRHGLLTLPGSLHEALDELSRDAVVPEALGPQNLRALHGWP